METKFCLSLVLSFLLGSSIAIAQPYYIKTPRGNNIECYYYGDSPEMIAELEAAADSLLNTNKDWDVEKIADASHSYNCHGYAWNVKEGGSNTVVYGWLTGTDFFNPNQEPVNNPTNLEKYWTNNGGYVQMPTPSPGYKAYYGSRWILKDGQWSNERDHSAVVHSDPEYFISKWGNLPLYKHKLNHCPYEPWGIIYYGLNPILQGDNSILCNSQTRTFSEPTMSYIALNYQWSNTIVGIENGGTGYNYNTVKANTGAAGYATVALTVTSPSGATASTQKSFWVGAPVISNVTGPSYCQVGASASYNATITDLHANATSYNWSIMPNIGNYFAPNGNCCYTIWYTATSYAISVNAQNVCGTGFTHWYPIWVVAGGRYFSVSPNPASNNVQVTITKNQTTSTNFSTTTVNDTDTLFTSANTLPIATESSTDIPKIYAVRILNSFGTLFYSAKKEEDTFTIPTNNLKDGTYIVEIIDGKQSYNQKLVIKH